MKKTIIFALLFFMLIGVVSASEDMNESISLKGNDADTVDTLGIGQVPTDTLKTTNEKSIQANDTSLQKRETPTFTVSDVSGTQGKEITLKATVKNSTGAISGIKVTFTLNGNTYTALSDENGIASVKVKCPNSAAVKTTSRTSGKILTKTTMYSKTYTATASIGEVKKSFKVISKKANLLKKYRIVKKTKIVTLPVKSGMKGYKKGNYGVITVKKTSKGITTLGVSVIGKKENGPIKFYAKDHYKENGKWHWAKWYKIKKGKMYTITYNKNIKINKIKVRYTQVSYKKI